MSTSKAIKRKRKQIDKKQTKGEISARSAKLARKKLHYKKIDHFYFETYHQLRINDLITFKSKPLESIEKMLKRNVTRGLKEPTKRQRLWVAEQIKKVNPKDKRLISNAFKAKQKTYVNEFIKIDRKRGESNKNYLKRLKKVQSGLGQTSPLKGVYLHVSKELAESAIVNKNGILETKPFKQAGLKGKIKEVYLPIQRAAYLKNPDKYIRKLVKEYNPKFIAPMYGSGSAGGQNLAVKKKDERVNRLIEDMEFWREQYSKPHPDRETGRMKDGLDIADHLNGFIIRISV